VGDGKIEKLIERTSAGKGRRGIERMRSAVVWSWSWRERNPQNSSLTILRGVEGSLTHALKTQSMWKV